jgi:hypothetical protein
MSFMEPKKSDWRGDKKLITPFIVKQKGCKNTNKAKEDLNERHQRGPKTQTHKIGGGEEIKGGTKKPKAPLTIRTWKT